MRELVAGEELRCNPDDVDFSPWLRQEVLSLPCHGPVRFPASFDRSVWPRPEDLDSKRGQSAAQDRPGAKNVLELVPATDCERSGSHVNEWRIAATLVTFRGALSQAFKRGCEAQSPATAWIFPRGWLLLGYDVLDSGLAISGLLNCGSPAVENARSVLQRHRVELNRFCLWSTPKPAGEFASELDRLVSDHAPFEVMGLYACRSGL